jgi:hypothetical protein
MVIREVVRGSSEKAEVPGFPSRLSAGLAWSLLSYAPFIRVYTYKIRQLT